MKDVFKEWAKRVEEFKPTPIPLFPQVESFGEWLQKQPQYNYETSEIPCMWDIIMKNPSYHGQAMGLSCPCPKCSPRC